MEIGAENKKKLIAAVVLILVAVVALGRQLFSPSGPPPASAAAPARVPSQAVSKAAPVSVPAKKVTRMQPSLDPTLRYDWLKASEDTKYEGRGRNIFRAEAEVIPPPVDNGALHSAPQPPPQDTGPPPPPPINLVFFGFANTHGGPKKVFLSEGDDVFVAGEGEIVDRRYKILHISPTSVEVEDVLNNNRQQLPLRQG